ncbi:hypothetical protein PV11_07050 [Exophiala sideris]|uniref:DUF7918 domain-containing protein n=1 Tax=Exophiala sideris TaxID=1016849 RepID=A0A0D1VTM6_9EURO|nr:hypothetical protein PV11_07050 [Exophiala sideris]
MAILGLFEAQVIVNGMPAAEYDDDEEPLSADPTLMTKYVEAVSGAYFELNVDSNYEGGKITKRHHFGHDGARVVLDGHVYIENGKGKQYKLKFADLETRDLDRGDEPSKFKEKYSELGTLKVEIWRVQITGESTPSRYQGKEIGSVPEKALKGRPLDVVTSHVPVDVPLRNHVGTTRMGYKPDATFIFKYRTRRALQSLMIIERSPTPLPLEERPVEELTREEMAELLRRQREQLEIKQEHANLKRERAGTITDPRPLKSSKGENGEVIYHLDSDSEDDAEEKVEPEVEVLDDDEDDGTTDPEIEVVDL